jgi:hypothetical protein
MINEWIKIQVPNLVEQLNWGKCYTWCACNLPSDTWAWSGNGVFRFSKEEYASMFALQWT